MRDKVINGYLVPTMMQKAWGASLRSYRELYRICNEHGLRVFATWGTLLGAIRHKGFIPWDDDIDVCMLRKDYDKFLICFLDERHKLATYYNTKKYYYPFAKIYDSYTYLDEMMKEDCHIGINIDVFPIDNLCADDFKNKRNYKTIRFYRNIIAGKLFWLNTINPLKNGLIRVLASLISGRFAAKQIDNISKKYKEYHTKRIGHIAWGYPMERDMLPDYAYDESFLIKFESIMVNCPKEYDLILKTHFDDYMKLPPKNEQQSGHHFKAYLKESEDYHD